MSDGLSLADGGNHAKATPGGKESGGGGSSAAAVQDEDELAGVGLSFYSQIYVLKVPIAHSLHAHALI